MRKNIFFSIFAFIIILGLVSFIYTANNVGSNHFSFGYFLSLFENYQPLVFTNSLTNNIITGSWGVFDFLRVFINSFIGVINGLVYVFSCLINIIQFLLYFIVGVFYI